MEQHGIVELRGTAFYLRRQKVGAETYSSGSVMHPQCFGMYYTGSNERVYIDEWDLLAQRKTRIPVKKITLELRPAWIQTDKNISKTHQLGDEIAEFYRDRSEQPDCAQACQYIKVVREFEQVPIDMKLN